jgi:anhydro-N-acetylmuramic acid kinase
MSLYYIGLMSGTSVDGIDAVLADLSKARPVLLAAQTSSWNTSLHKRILESLNQPTQISLDTLGQLDVELGAAFADAALAIISAANLQPKQITAIGSHGQTLLHAPNANPPFSLQAGDANVIAARTGITTVADFRRRDIAVGGQGAPLVPAFHKARFSQSGVSRAILNIGGIANVTLLPADARPVSGFDTGPGNVLLDAWISKHRNTGFDRDGEWAASGSCSQPLLERMMREPYLGKQPPKSTGRELFCMHWLETILAQGFGNLPAVVVQTTLVEFTATSITRALQQYAAPVDEIFVCGGGAHNHYLLQRLQALLPNSAITTTEALGLHPDWVEATAFAWLAKQTLEGKPGNLPSVTGANRPSILGAIYPG